MKTNREDGMNAKARRQIQRLENSIKLQARIKTNYLACNYVSNEGGIALCDDLIRRLQAERDSIERMATA
jgi:hypothetical protein